MTSRFHHLLGTTKFAPVSIPSLILLLPGLTFPSLERMFDGVYGLQLLLWLALLSVALWRRPKRVCAAFLPFLFLVAAWFASSPQARFLLPALTFFALAVRDAFPLVRGRAGRFFLWTAVILSLFSFPPEHCRPYLNNLGPTFSGGDGRRDILYGRTGDAMLPAVDILRSILADGGRCLMVMEERTLYFPRECEIGTPFFQDKYFPGGAIPDPDGMLRLLDDVGFTCLYLCVPDRNPDYLPQAAELWEPRLYAVLDDLVKRGELVPVPPERMPEGTALLIRRKP
jgi:hypothetical protein